MTVLIVQGQIWAAFAEAFQQLDLAVQRNAVQRVFMHKSEMVPLDPPYVQDRERVQKKPRHHDHLIQRHVRSHQHASRRP